MKNLIFDFKKCDGKMKPMHCVNNGPIGSAVRKTGNVQAYRDLKIPYARLHDSAFCTGYGGEWTVDVHRIFCNFDADENREESYDFSETDVYLQRIKDAGTEIFYRLGASIEHGKKFGTFPPKDFLKWAKICEHIILHYNEGWANGFHMNIRYWEIWNEPDCHNADGSNPCWQGTDEQFFEFFNVVSKYLKGKFPALKIGGPAVCWIGTGFAQKFLPYAKENGVPLDFISYHLYSYSIDYSKKIMREWKKLAIENGYSDAEMILNEWNYIYGWAGEDFDYSMDVIHGLKGSAFALGVMCVGQESGLDMLMYYEARPCGFNGIFGYSGKDKLKTYYTFMAFSHLYELGHYVKPQGKIGNIYSCGAYGENEKAFLITSYYEEKEKKFLRTVLVNCKNVGFENYAVEYYKVDKKNNLSLVKTENGNADECVLSLKLREYNTYLVKIIKK